MSKEMTPERLAQKIGKSSKTIHRWEEGEQYPDGRMIVSIGQALGVSPAWLLVGTEELLKAQPEVPQSISADEGIISSIGYDQQLMIRDILRLHCNGKMIECDTTYSTGNFYKAGIPEPQFKFDIDPQCKGVLKASADKLPLQSASIGVMMFDPPFIMNGESKKPKDKKTGLIGKRFTSFGSWKELRAMYSGALKEAARVLEAGGILIFKCQDSVVSGKNHFTHVWVMNQAIQCGLYPKDLFVLVAKTRMLDGRAQKHAHSYFWVFVNANSRVEYDGLFISAKAERQVITKARP